MHDKVGTNIFPLLFVDEVTHKDKLLFSFSDDIASLFDLRVRKASMSIDARMPPLVII